jgi:glycoside hydrolase-like protein
MKRLLRSASTLAALPLLAGIAFSTPAYALPNGSGIDQAKGFDTCQDPNTSQMQAFWTGTPYFWLGTYIGGSLMACSQPNLSADYLNSVHSQGWDFEFIWVGPQPPCTGYNQRFSSDPNTAYQQGKNEAISAWSLLTNTLGVTNFAGGTALVYDLESSPSACQAATNSFISGWDYQLQLAPAQKAGVYGSVCGSNLAALASISNVPDFIWGAWYNGNPSTGNLDGGGCGVPNGWWGYSQRLKQYNGGHNETWNGVTLNIDNDCANGPTDPNGSGTYTDPACP